MSLSVSPAGGKVFVTGESMAGTATGYDYATVAYSAIRRCASGRGQTVVAARGAGRHTAVPDVAGQARQHWVTRLMFAHIGRPRCARLTPETLPFGE